jgi:hypothetical protein
MEQRKATLKLERLPADNEDQWRSKQFHACIFIECAR